MGPLFRAAVYVRVSTPGQADPDKEKRRRGAPPQAVRETSHDTQEAAARAHCAAHGYTVAEAHVYRETGSGVTLEPRARPRLAELRAAVRRRQVDVVVAYAIDRLSREPVHLAVLVFEAEDAGARVEFVTESLDDSPEGALIRQVRAYAAKIEHEKFKERSHRGRRARAAAGMLLPGRSAPYGYRWRDENKGALDLDPATAPVVARIFRDYLGELSMRQIAAALEVAKVPTARGGRGWYVGVVRQILRSPVYAGRPAAFRWAQALDEHGRATGRRTDAGAQPLPAGVAPAIVSEEDFLTVQRQFSVNRGWKPNPEERESYLLRGMARCGFCGGRLAVRRRKAPGGGYYRQYACRAAADPASVCPFASISARVLDAAAWRRVKELVCDPAVVEAELAALEAEDAAGADAEAVARAIAEVERRQRAQVLAGERAGVDEFARALIAERLAELARERRELEAERARVASRAGEYAAARSSLADFRAWAAGALADLDALGYAERRRVLVAFGLEAMVWDAKHSPRFELRTARLPGRGADGAGAGSEHPTGSGSTSIHTDSTHVPLAWRPAPKAGRPRRKA